MASSIPWASGHPTLILRSKKRPEPEIFSLDQKEIGIGRDQSNFVVLESRAVSRNHARIVMEGGGIFLIDLKSPNGTYLNGHRLLGGEKTLLRPGDKIKIEDFEFHIQVQDKVTDPYEITDTDVLEVKMIKKILKVIDKETSPSLEILKGRYAGKKMTLDGKTQTVIVGRDPACEWMLDEEVISRRHAKIQKKWDSVLLEDLGSKNGTFVNNVKIKEKQIKDGDSILFGTIPARFRNPQDINLETLEPLITKQPEPEPEPPVSTPPPEEKSEPLSDLIEQSPDVEKASKKHSLGLSEMIWFILGGVVLVLCVAAIISLV